MEIDQLSGVKENSTDRLFHNVSAPLKSMGKLVSPTFVVRFEPELSDEEAMFDISISVSDPSQTAQSRRRRLLQEEVACTPPTDIFMVTALSQYGLDEGDLGLLQYDVLRRECCQEGETISCPFNCTLSKDRAAAPNSTCTRRFALIQYKAPAASGDMAIILGAAGGAAFVVIVAAIALSIKYCPRRSPGAVKPRIRFWQDRGIPYKKDAWA